MFAGRDDCQLKISGRFVDLEDLRGQMAQQVQGKAVVELFKAEKAENPTQQAEIAYHLFVCGPGQDGGDSVFDEYDQSGAVLLSPDEVAALVALVPVHPSILLHFLAFGLPLSATAAKVDRAEVIRRFCPSGAPAPGAEGAARGDGKKKESRFDYRRRAMRDDPKWWRLRLLILSIFSVSLIAGRIIAQSGLDGILMPTLFPIPIEGLRAEAVQTIFLFMLLVGLKFLSLIGFVPMVHLFKVHFSWHEDTDGCVRRRPCFFWQKFGELFRQFLWTYFPARFIHFEVAATVLFLCGSLLLPTGWLVQLHIIGDAIIVALTLFRCGWRDHAKIFWATVGIFASQNRGGPGSIWDRILFHPGRKQPTPPKDEESVVAISSDTVDSKRPLEMCLCKNNPEKVYVDARGSIGKWTNGTILFHAGASCLC